ncbi:alpha-galactosidase [Parablautia intestinalis]|uniref:alpha-galactosidase n=1 Tax=Parablautia intestinalis TaxID=2320100 RepID=UPI0023D05573|nr:alpha-galactosidase [Parablautia intestinalis]MDE7048701.1 alpha-galactosidase [Lachnospiraceae bacterium]
MGITYFEQERIFKLDTASTSYLIGIVDEENFPGHIYYGKRITDHRLGHLLRVEEPPFVPSRNAGERVSFLDTFATEYPTHGVGDYREAALKIRTKDGHRACGLHYVSHEIFEGKKKIPGLPTSFAGESGCSTIEIVCVDKHLNLKVILSYCVFEKEDVITRHVAVENDGSEEFFIEKAASMSIDMDNRDFEMLTLHGSWARERHKQRRKLGIGYQGTSSGRGESSHQNHPFMALMTENCTWDQGEIYGVQMMYSGNFDMQAEVNQFNCVRWQAGIGTKDFCWKLAPGETFYTPEALLTYSAEGIDKMTANYHEFIRNHVLRGKYKDKKRPILINNWEATYFAFDTEKLLSIAKQAAGLGIEMLVMDDGWFGKRNLDNCSLGDWQVNEQKLPGGLSYLVDEVNKLGMKFGIWFEPEMVSPDSDLYREHPDWAIAVPGRTPGMVRTQYVLDFSRKEVVDNIWNQMELVLKSANVEYVKWDMNRPLSDLGSAVLEPERQGELAHRYMLGVYELQERLVTNFPDVLLENCSGGGARFDAGMLYYSPQIWCSDDTDAIERLAIQEGTAMIYPLSTMGAHISDCPNHAVGRTTPFETRGYVALAGTFGYELDVTRIPDKDREMIPDQVALYHKYNDLVREGDYYRLESYQDNHLFDCWQVVSKDKKESLVTWIQVLGGPSRHSRVVRLKGLAPDKRYRIEGEDMVLTGDSLMYAGICMPVMSGDFLGKLVHLVQE